MATFTRTCTGKWKATIRKNNRYLTSKTFTRKTDAREWAATIELDNELMYALGKPEAGMTLAKLADEYHTAWNGHSGARYRIRFWKEQLGHRRLIDITPSQIQTILDDYSSGRARRGNGVGPDGKTRSAATRRRRSPASINRMKACLSSMYQYACRRQYIDTNPVRKISSIPENNKRIRFLTEDERNALLKACKASQWPKLHLLVVLALTTGARQGELLKLRWGDIDFNGRTATLHTTKNGEPRILTLPSPAMERLKPWREIGDGLLFPSVIRPNRHFEFRKHWDKALVDAGIGNFRFHDLRHSAASYLVMNGATLYETAEILGHKSVQTTARYAHLSVNHKAELTERVFGAIFCEEKT